MDALRAALERCRAPWKASELYEVASDTKVLDESLRRSSFRALAEPELFALARELLAAVSARDAHNAYVLIENNVTHIKARHGRAAAGHGHATRGAVFLPHSAPPPPQYDVGGFFAAHSDYLSLTSNVVRGARAVGVCCAVPAARAVTPPRPARRSRSTRSSCA